MSYLPCSHRESRAPTYTLLPEVFFTLSGLCCPGLAPNIDTFCLISRHCWIYASVYYLIQRLPVLSKEIDGYMFSFDNSVPCARRSAGLGVKRGERVEVIWWVEVVYVYILY